MSEISELHFEVEIDSGRSWLEENSDIEIYSLNKSFYEEDVLWKFNLYGKNGKTVEGFVEKLKEKKKIQFLEDDAISAIEQNFLRASNLNTSPKKNPQKFNSFKGKNVAFTLRTKLNEKEALHEFKSISFENDLPEVEKIKTSKVYPRESFASIHGLLITKEIFSLEVCAEILAKKFPRELITWLTYCTDKEKYMARYDIA